MFFFAQRGIKIIHTWSTAFQKIKPIVMFAVCFKEVWGVKKLNCVAWIEGVEDWSKMK